MICIQYALLNTSVTLVRVYACICAVSFFATMSSHSTTATATYVLQKYSRSYPPTKENNNSEWQHFTNPTIRLILDIKKSSDAKLESVRLRIIWSMNASNDDLSDRNEVVFVRILPYLYTASHCCSRRISIFYHFPLSRRVTRLKVYR